MKLEITIPTNLEDIELWRYQKYLEAYNKIDKESATVEQEVSNMLVNIFCDLSYDDMRKVPVQLITMASEKVAECLGEPTPLVRRFTARGSDGVEIEFGFVPKLDDMTFGEYIDLDTFIGDWSQIHKAMAVLYRPIIKSKFDYYDIEVYENAEKYEDIMKHIPANIAIGAWLFFYRLRSKLSIGILRSSTQALPLEERRILEQNLLEENGVGINQYMESLREMSYDLTKLQANLYTNV